jgi:hypothetical protein
MTETMDIKPAFSPNRSALAKGLVYRAFRNSSLLEDLNAAGIISDREIKVLMTEAVNKVYTYLSFPEIMAHLRAPAEWDDAELDKDTVLGFAVAGLFGLEEQEKALAALAKGLDGGN